MKQKIFITGSRGLIGTRVQALLGDQYELVPLNRGGELSVEITDRDSIARALEAHPDGKALIHLAAFTDVTAAYQQTDDKTGVAWQVNVEGTKNIALECAARDIYLIHASTAYVFAGDKPEPYTENDPVSPIEWYGRTKAEAENQVLGSDSKSVILRLDQPFTHVPFAKVDTLHRIITGLQEGKLYPQFTNHWFGPTYIDDLVKVMDLVLRKQLTGIYHATAGEQWSDFDFAQMVARELGIEAEVKPGNLDDYLKTLERPYQRNTALNTAKLQAELDFKMLTITEAVSKVKTEK